MGEPASPPLTSEEPRSTGQPGIRSAPVVLDYATPARRRLPGWLTRPLGPGTAAAIWLLCSLVLRLADPRLFYPHVTVGVAFCATAKVIGWQVGLLWKVQALLALGLLALGIELFMAPWRRWGFSMTYWTTYNQTYIYNHDASLRVVWVPALALVWLAATAVGAHLAGRLASPQRSSGSCPPDASLK